MTLENILADFQLLDYWEDRYRYVIELGRALPPLPEAARTEANKVRGCASQVWLATEDNGATAGAAPRLRNCKSDPIGSALLLHGSEGNDDLADLSNGLVVAMSIHDRVARYAAVIGVT